MMGTSNSNPVKMRILKAGHGRSPFVLFARSPFAAERWKKLQVDKELVHTAFGMLLCFAAFMIVALVVESLRGRL